MGIGKDFILIILLVLIFGFFLFGDEIKGKMSLSPQQNVMHQSLCNNKGMLYYSSFENYYICYIESPVTLHTFIHDQQTS